MWRAHCGLNVCKCAILDALVHVFLHAEWENLAWAWGVCLQALVLGILGLNGGGDRGEHRKPVQNPNPIQQPPAK
jgi:hypothetical protein